MKRIFGLVGYACNGKSTIIKKIANNKQYTFIDLPQIYKNEAYKHGYDGVTAWYQAVGLEKYQLDSRKAVFRYIEKQLPRAQNLIIDDIFDIEIYKKLINIFPQMELIAFHSKYSDRLKRLSTRANIKDENKLIEGLNNRDDMKRFCGIEEIFPHCKYEITNKNDIEHTKKLFDDQIAKNQIISIVGYSGSGKSSICKFLGTSLDIPIFYYGKEVSKILKKKGFAKSRYFVKEFGIEEYTKLMETELPKILERFMKKNKFFILDGLVSDDILDSLKKDNEVYSIYIMVDKKIRVKRLAEREKIDEKKALEEIDIKDSMKIGSGLDIVVSKCNAIIDGKENFDVVINQIIDLIDTLN